jgi:hypothetical protein
MKIFRSHNIQFFSTILLLAGMLFYFLKPVNNNGDDDAFTSWLQSHVKAGDNSHVIDQIQKLSNSDEQLESLIREASTLVRSHADDFKLPIQTGNNDENDVFNVLLSEWTAHQNAHTGMGKSIILKQSHSFSVLPVDGFSLSGKVPTAVFLYTEVFNKSILQDVFQSLIPYQLIPLSGGIAIGAP